MRSPTHKDIAKAAGVHQTTVSRALNNDPRISEALKKRIQEVADEMGYRLNPFVSAHMAHVRSRKRPSDRGVIALANAWQPGRNALRESSVARIAEGARCRAEELDWRLETFRLGEGGLAPARLTEILKARGVEGALITPIPESADLVAHFEPFASVAVGQTLVPSLMTAVSTDPYTSTYLLCDQLRKYGYRRIALWIDRYHREMADPFLEAGFRAFQRHVPRKDQMPVFAFLGDSSLNNGLARELQDRRLDAIVSQSPWVCELLEEARIRVPDDVGLAILDRPKRKKELPGFDYRYEELGAHAVEQVVDALCRNQRGIGSQARKILMPGRWVSGISTCQVQ